MNPTFTVSDFIAVTNQTLEFAYPIVEIEGEVASFKVNQGKFVFFDIKDSGGSVGCFMMLFQLRVPIEDGMKVVISASPKLTQWGKFSLTVRSIRPSGEGSIKKSFELLKAKLEKEGLFAADRKRLLPAIPHRIAVISSTQAAGYADFMKILSDRWGGLMIDVAHVTVQGADAPEQIIRALHYFNGMEELADVIVLIRGGGSADDLAAFNDELLVRAVAESRIPTVTGIGHEVDTSLCDLVSDVRAATPSNAAQIIVPDRHDVIRRIRHQVDSLFPIILNYLVDIQKDVRSKVMQSFSETEQRLQKQIDDMNRTRRVLTELDPERVLERGYAIIRGGHNVGDEIAIELQHAILNARIEKYVER